MVSASDMIIARFYEDRREEIEYIVRAAADAGLDLSASEAVVLWERYSERFYRTSWYVPDSDWHFSVNQFTEWVKQDCQCADPVEFPVEGFVSQVTFKSNPFEGEGNCLGVFYTVQLYEGGSFDVPTEESFGEAKRLISHRAFGRVYIDG